MNAEHDTPDDSIPGTDAPSGDPVTPDKEPTNGPMSDVEPHEPPIIIGGGDSLYIDLPEDKDIDAPSPILANPRPFKHGLKNSASSSIRALGQVKVLIEPRFEKGHPKLKEFKDDILIEDRNFELQIWLEQLREDNGDYDPIQPEAEPQLILAGNPFKLEVDRELQGPTSSFRVNRPRRYNHPGYKRRFRIRKWRIVAADGTELTSMQGDEAYWFACSFHHPH